MSAVTAPVPTRPPWRPSPVVGGLPVAARAGLAILAGLFLFLVGAGGLGAVLAIGLLALPFGLVVWRWPMVGVLLLVVLGPIHQTLMLLVFHFTRTPLLLRYAQLWKELVVAVLLAKALDAAFRRGKAPRVQLLDLGLVMFIVYAAFYLLYPSEVTDDSPMLRVMGLRADAFFLLAYFVGRGLPLSKAKVRTVLLAFSAITLVIAAVAGLQFVAPGATNAFFAALSQREFTTLKQGEQAASFAVRVNDVKGFVIPRASSLVLSDLALAFYTLLAAPLAAALLLSLSGLRQRAAANVLLLSVLMTTVMTVTRSAMIAMGPALALVFLRGRGVLFVLLVAVQAAIGVLPIVYTRDITVRVLQDVFSPNEASALAHVAAIELSLETLREQPFGRGLGTAGQVAQLYAPDVALTNESWYLQIATEIGVAGGVMFAAIVVACAVSALVQYGRVRDSWLKALCLGMAGATVGFGIVGLTLHVWDAQTISILFWLLAGIAMRAPDLDAESAPARPA